MQASFCNFVRFSYIFNTIHCYCRVFNICDCSNFPCNFFSVGYLQTFVRTVRGAFPENNSQVRDWCNQAFILQGLRSRVDCLTLNPFCSRQELLVCLDNCKRLREQYFLRFHTKILVNQLKSTSE